MRTVEPNWIFRYYPLKIEDGGFMTIVDMLEQSGALTLLGMGIVFGFLVILIVSITLVGKGIQVLGLNKNAGIPPASAVSAPPAAAKTAAVTAAIGAAVTEYRKNEGK
jgi:oxaloacetate decarboxylase gamma subunit